MSLTYNNFKSTTVKGLFKNSDYNDGSILADGIFDRNLTIKGNLTIGKEISTTDANGNIIYTDSGGNISFKINNITYTITPILLSYLYGLTSNIQTQISSKANLANPTFTGTVSGITKSMVGLSNVDNTSDLNKPISTLTQNSLNQKANLSTTNNFTGSNNTFVNVNCSSLATLNNISCDTLTVGDLTTSRLINTPSLNVGSSIDSGHVNCTIFGPLNNVLKDINSTAFGNNNMQQNTTGVNNSSFGSVALNQNTIGSYNVAFGSSALSSNTIGSGNTAIGNSSLASATVVSGNTCVGVNSGIQISNTGYNTCIGAYTNTLYSYSTSIGAYSNCSANHQIMLGTSSEFVEIPGGLVLDSTLYCAGLATFQNLRSDNYLLGQQLTPAYMLDGSRTTGFTWYPITCSQYHLKSPDTDDNYVVYPRYKLIVYFEDGYIGSGFTIDNYTGTTPIYMSSLALYGAQNQVNSCKLYFMNDSNEITNSLIS